MLEIEFACYYYNRKLRAVTRLFKGDFKGDLFHVDFAHSNELVGSLYIFVGVQLSILQAKASCEKAP